ncbi:hypothetical protein K0M31_000506 [Melipona bicolor]|uniref:Uncharacterized protein n=1 Tax=Melipona bicolor TaxID=60889 RepID=A0AA40KWQ8_9HYME|nr:hypothetical protein K0M31_000506 [Melipona bicolor]
MEWLYIRVGRVEPDHDDGDDHDNEDDDGGNGGSDNDDDDDDDSVNVDVDDEDDDDDGGGGGGDDDDDGDDDDGDDDDDDDNDDGDDGVENDDNNDGDEDISTILSVSSNQHLSIDHRRGPMEKIGGRHYPPNRSNQLPMVNGWPGSQPAESNQIDIHGRPKGPSGTCQSLSRDFSLQELVVGASGRRVARSTGRFLPRRAARPGYRH